MFSIQLLQRKWEDGSIPKAAKGELIEKFTKHFGFQTPVQFQRIMGSKSQPTPDQYSYLKEQIEYYWGFYNEEPVAK